MNQPDSEASEPAGEQAGTDAEALPDGALLDEPYDAPSELDSPDPVDLDAPELDPESEPGREPEPGPRPESPADVEAVAEPEDDLAPEALSEPAQPDEPEQVSALASLPTGAASQVAADGAAAFAAAVDTEPESESEAAAEDEEAAVLGEFLPDISTDAALDAALESLLLVVDSPASEDTLATALAQPNERVEQALRRLAEEYTEQQRGIDLRRSGEGWRLFTRETYAPFVEKLLTDGQRAKLTRAALETLAVIAYRQPVTRSRIAAVRGVNVDGVIRTLLARGLVEETGADPDTGGTLYRTTELFLERLGLSSLEELPPIAPLLPEVDAIDDV